jgi:hypothetical protein
MYSRTDRVPVSHSEDFGNPHSSAHPHYTSEVHHKRVDENRTKAWFVVLTPLVLHFITVVSILWFLLLYVHENLFYTSNRRPDIVHADGTRTAAPFLLLQTDIITIVSSWVTVSRLLAATWCVSTAWRCALILLDKEGASLSELQRIFRWQLLFGARIGGRSTSQSSSRYARPVIVTILILLFPCQFSGPILTGSITWISSYKLLPSNVPLTDISSILDETGWRVYKQYPHSPLIPARANRYAILSYQSQEETNTMKRHFALEATNLTVNSRLLNITLPYFITKDLQWVRNPDVELDDAQLNLITNIPDIIYFPWTRLADIVFILVPDSWESPIGNETRTIPPSSVIRERRLVAGRPLVTDISTPCNGGALNLTDDIGFYDYRPTSGSARHECYIFAWITFEAGAADCAPCRVSASPDPIVQNDTELIIKPDPLTRDTLDLMRSTTSEMIRFSEIPLPDYRGDVSRYVSELLLRSYAATWTALTRVTGVADGDAPAALSTGVEIASEGLKAVVSFPRVFVWLFLNLLVTVSGAIFVLLQLSCSQPIVANPRLAAMLLDSKEVLHIGQRGFCNFSSLTSADQEIGNLRVRADRVGHRKLELAAAA